jgi:hypothetical protein
MDRHVRILATLSVVFGVVSSISALLVLILFGGISRLWNWAEGYGGLGILATGTVLLHLLVAIPTALAGAFLFRFAEWARILMVVACAVNLLNPPFGSILGGYGLWVLMMPETEPLFAHPVPRRNRTPPH